MLQLTSNGRPEEDECHPNSPILLLNLPAQHNKEQHVGEDMLEAGVNQDAGNPPVPARLNGEIHSRT